jgi:hypothetical protein
MVGDDDDVYFKKLFVPDPGLDPGWFEYMYPYFG